MALKIGSGLTVKTDRVKEAMRAIKTLTKMEIMVGIPESKAEREPSTDEPHPASNAVIGYVHEHGDPEHNLPARPFLGPGVAESQDDWAKSLETAAILAFRGDEDGMRAALGRAGQRAVTAVQEVIRRQDFAPLAPRTLEERLRKIGVIRPKLIKQYNQMNPAQQQEFISNNIMILMDTNAMFRAITWVLREKGSNRDIKTG